MRFFSPIGFKWKKVNVEKRERSHVGPQRKEKHIVVVLIKMAKKTMGPQRGKKRKKEKNFCTISYLLHWSIRAMGPLTSQQNKRGQKICYFVAKTSF